MANHNLTAEQVQKLQRDTNKMVMAMLFLVIFVGWVATLVYLITFGIAASVYEGFGLGSITGALLVILTNVYQFFFRKSSTEIQNEQGVTVAGSPGSNTGGAQNE